MHNSRTRPRAASGFRAGFLRFIAPAAACRSALAARSAWMMKCSVWRLIGWVLNASTVTREMASMSSARSLLIINLPSDPFSRSSHGPLGRAAGHSPSVPDGCSREIICPVVVPPFVCNVANALVLSTLLCQMGVFLCL